MGHESMFVVLVTSASFVLSNIRIPFASHLISSLIQFILKSKTRFDRKKNDFTSSENELAKRREKKNHKNSFEMQRRWQARAKKERNVH